MGERPPGMTLSRIDNDGNYSPKNCTWATAQEQAENRRNVHWVEYGGGRMTLKSFARTIGVNRNALYHRLSQGWSLEQVVTHYSDRGNWQPRPRKVDR